MKALVLVLSADVDPYSEMIDTAMSTWDSISVEGFETIYYCDGDKQNTDKVIYVNTKFDFKTMGEKTLRAFEWALNNKDFDYIVRVHSSCYVNKKTLLNYISKLDKESVFCGIEAGSKNGFQYLWGGGHYIISKDVIKKFVDNRDLWDHNYMEDESMSLLATKLGVPYTAGASCSINIKTDGYLLLCYGYESILFNDFSELKDNPNHFYRVKQDGKRYLDKVIMEELYKNLNG